MVSWGKVTENPHKIECCQNSHITSNTQSKISQNNYISVATADFPRIAEILLTSLPKNQKLYSIKV